MKKTLITILSVAIMVLFIATAVMAAAETDVVLKKVPTVTGQQPTNGNSAPAKVLTDGNHNWSGSDEEANLWFGSNTGKDSKTNCDIKMTWNLSKVYQISRYVVWSGPDWKQDDCFDAGNKTYAAKDWKLQVSLDGKKWTDADTVKGNIYVRAERKLAKPVNARYVRVWFTKKAEKVTGFAGDFWPALRLSDISIYGQLVK